ncbi:ABC transporter substrate-binding protein [Herbiconiux sp. KACC 21604]|uniref:ABC transporter substrate-binding protein n=1 Tax=unclassified Herbiconiux TaxID=2618217 RepID=UPI001491F251|nr:ABC transporter substrate-binding protein [Herbiconiux sp. SALV-R1]QJU55669.1 carbohydrate ABC transporter substrate-binding protein [Herbiconiux sp. SALV-R1]WPO86872.1 ABC transporter substrate-binding protein [Herbiconiux sp. KACC 21604]
MSQRQRFRRPLLVIGIGAVSALMLAGCSTAEPSGGGDATGSDVTLTFAYPKAGSTTPWETMAEKYSEETGVKVEVEPIYIDGYDSAINTRLQGGNAPDLFLTEPGTGPKGLVSLGDAGLLGEVSGAAADLINPDESAAYGSDGKAYGMPVFNAPRAAVVFDGNLEKAGVEWPQTVSEMLQSCPTAKSNGYAFTLGQFGSSFTADGQAILIAASSVYANDPDWDAKRAAGDVTFSDTEGWRYAIQTLSDMYQAGCYQDGAEAAQGEFWTGVAAGETPSVLSLTTGEADIWKDLSGLLPNETTSVYPFPGETADDVRVVNSVKFTLSTAAANANNAVAQDYLEWLAQPENLQQIADITGTVPAGDLNADSLEGVYEPIKSLVADGKVISEPGLTWPNGVLAAMQEDVPGLFTGQKTVDQVLADMDAAWSK